MVGGGALACSRLRLTIRHHYDFGPERELVGSDLVQPASWDALRTGTSGAFSLAATREEWERQADERTEIRERAEVVAQILRDHSASRVASYGVGAALLELWLERLAPDIELVLTDYAPATVERLAALFPEGRVQQHDLLRDAPIDADMHLFHRIDTELTNAQWREVLPHFAAERVLVVATEIIDVRRAVAELRTRLRNRKASRAGWVRNREAFESLWRSTHDAAAIPVGDLEGWLLSPRARR